MDPDNIGIEVKFSPNKHGLVAHIPGPGSGSCYWLADDAPSSDDMCQWPRLQRAILRAMLNEALRRLDESEPTSTIGLAQ